MKKLLPIVLVAMMVIALVPVTTADQTQPVDVQSAFPWLSECNEDLTGETLTFYHFGDLSGAYAFITQPLIQGIEDVITIMNDNGGICGAEVAQQFDDTGGAQEQTQAFWDDYSANDDAHSIFLYASADGELLRSQAAESNIVLYNAAGSEIALYGEDGQSPSYQFSIIPLYVDQLGYFCEYVSENWGDLGVDGDPVIGHLSWEGAFGRSTDTAETRAYCESLGVGYAGAEYFLPGTPDISTQLANLLDEGANIIYSTSLASGPAQVAGTVAAAEAPVLLAGTNWALDTSVIALGGEAANGFYGNLPYLWWDELDQPGVQQVVAFWSENRLAVDPEAALRIRNVAYLSSYGTVDLWAEVMIRAINEVGYENLSGEVLYNVLDNDFVYEPFNGLLRADFTGGNRAGAESRIGQIQFLESDAGVTPSVVPLTDWSPIPDLRPGGADAP